ncbi:MAG: hypothetical protein EOO12_09830 [Chitinophagaceae bacterium]|nr:MAG: hypothetical protein EOO12_09830 [Chitinophagaceae bacterium]
MIRYLFLLLTTCMCGALAAQPGTLSVKASKQMILIGEPLELEVAVTAAGPVAPVALDSIPFFEVLETRAADTVRQGSNYTVRQVWVLTSWDSGLRRIPPIPYAGRASQAIPIAVRFSSPFDKNAPYHDIKDVEQVEVPARNTWIWYVVLAILLAGIALLLFPRHKGEAVKVVRVDEHYYKKVLQQLQALQQDEARRREPKQFYTDLVTIFRGYLLRRKGYYSDADTSTDLVQRLPQWRVPASLQEELRATLQESDLVKFARLQPGGTAMDGAVQTLKRAVVALEEHSR